MVLWACLFGVTEGCTRFPRHIARKKSTLSRKLRIETNPGDRISQPATIVAVSNKAVTSTLFVCLVTTPDGR